MDDSTRELNEGSKTFKELLLASSKGQDIEIGHSTNIVEHVSC